MDTNQRNDNSVIENVASAKKLFMIFGGFGAIGLIVIMLSIFIGNLPSTPGGMFVGFAYFIGHGICALPCICAFVFKLGAFVDIGPMFTTHYSVIGNFIYRTVQRDYMSQMGGNIIFTFIKLLIIFLVSIVLTPIITVVLYIIYKKAYKDAAAYADANGIDKKDIPVINKTLVRVVAIILAALFVGSIIASAVSDKVRDKEREETSVTAAQMLENAIANIPEEYYAEAVKGQKETEMGGFIAEFTLDGKKVYAGKISTNFKLIEGITSLSEYFIIDGVMYLDVYCVDRFEESDNAEIKKYLLSRHLTGQLGEDAQFSHADLNPDNNRIEYTFNGEKHCIYTDNSANITKIQLIYTTEEYHDIPETAFVLKGDFDLTALKNRAKDIINK